MNSYYILIYDAVSRHAKRSVIRRVFRYNVNKFITFRCFATAGLGQSDRHLVFAARVALLFLGYLFYSIYRYGSRYLSRTKKQVSKQQFPLPMQPHVFVCFNFLKNKLDFANIFS